MNVLFCVGCDQYEVLSPLNGAERDARSMFDALNNLGFYETDHSRLLLSPSMGEMAKSLAETLRKDRISVLTFFFAGHACGKNGSFFITLRDSEAAALSTTAFPLSRLFEMVNEFHPSHVNVIIDGCEAGSSTSSMHTLLGSENVGTVQASSISFLGACAANQYAGESDAGGLLTNQILRTLRGETDLVFHKPFIELSDIAAHVSDAVVEEAPDQRPISWGLNLFGGAGLTYNPRVQINHPLPSLSLTQVDPNSAMGRHLIQLSPDLWDEYRLLSKDFDPVRLNPLLHRLLSPDELLIADRVAAISGLIGSFSSVAAADGEMLAPQLCSSTCLVSLLPWIDDPAVQMLVRRQIQKDCETTNELLAGLVDDLQTKGSRLLAHNGVLSDVYYLPLRITRLLGLIGSLALIGRILQIETDQSKSRQRQMIQTIISVYSRQLIALDDEQASPLYIFFKAAQYMGWLEEAREVLENLYGDAASRGGVLNRVGSGGQAALEHILSISKSKFSSERPASANPSSLLPVIFLAGIWFESDQDWDLQAFDRCNIGLFFPTDFRNFSEMIMSSGYTHTWHVGFGIWKTEELESQFREVLSTRSIDSKLPLEGHILCILSAMLFPDRIPLCLESLS